MTGLSIFLLSQIALAQTYSSVSPGVFSFGSCGGVNGDTAPAASESYSSRFMCMSSYNSNQCDMAAEQIRDFLIQYGTLNECSNWLNEGLSQCYAYMTDMDNQWCNSLSH